MTSFIIVKLSNLHILLNITSAISPVNFSFLGCLDLILLRGVENTPQCCNGREKPSAFRVKKVKALIDKPLDEMGLCSDPRPCGPIQLEDVRLAMKKVKCPRKLDISVFYQLTRRLPHEELEYDDERIITHLYDTFCNESLKLLGKTVRCRVNVLYHLLANFGKEPNADLFPFMKGASHQRTEEEIKFEFEHLGWSYSPVQLV